MLNKTNFVLFSLFIYLLFPISLIGQSLTLSKMSNEQKENLGYYLQFLEKCYLQSNFQHPKNMQQLINFCKDEAPFPLTFQDSLSITIYHDTISFLYKDDLLCRYPAEELSCYYITESPFYYDFAAVYDNNGNYIYVKGIRKKWLHIRHRIYSQMSNGNYFLIKIPADSIELEIDNKPRQILYQFDYAQGLSVHETCNGLVKLPNNAYINQLKKASKKICDKYRARKFIFSAFILVEDNSSHKFETIDGDY